MTTEFRRAQAAVETTEKLVTDLGVVECPEGFRFYPRPRAEVAIVDEDDWVVVGSLSSTEVPISMEQCANFAEAEMRFAELEPVVEHLRRRCRVRADFEGTKYLLRQHLDADGLGSSNCCEHDTKQLFADSQAFLQRRGPGHEAVRALLTKAMKLEAASATYGTKMVEQVLDLLTRHDASRALFNTDIVPRLGASVAASVAHDEMHRRVLERRLTAEAEEKARHEAWRPVAALMAASELQQQALLEARDLAEWQCAQPLEENLRMCPADCSLEASSALPSIVWMYS